LLPLFAALPLQADELSSRTLRSGWQFRAIGNTEATANTDKSDVKQWHPAQFPGVVQTDLLRNGLIPDPFDRDNEFRLQWIGLTDWEYQTVFQADAASLGHDHVDLVFDGLDTLADVYLNDQVFLSDATATYDYPDRGFGSMPAAEVHHATIVVLAASTAHVMSVDDMEIRISSHSATLAGTATH
jgi:hypothetical protein